MRNCNLGRLHTIETGVGYGDVQILAFTTTY